MLLTGDNASAANSIAKGAHIDTVHADLLPEDKSDRNVNAATIDVTIDRAYDNFFKSSKEGL